MEKYQGQIPYKAIIITKKEQGTEKHPQRQKKACWKDILIKQIKTITYHFKRSLKTLRNDIKYKRTPQSDQKNF